MQKYYYMIAHMQAAHAIKLCIPGRAPACKVCIFLLKGKAYFPRMHHPTPGGRTRPAALDLSSRWESDNNLAARSAPQREKERRWLLHAAVGYFLHRSKVSDAATSLSAARSFFSR